MLTADYCCTVFLRSSEGGAGSYFKIPAWVKNGVIHVKAYTQWMLNFDNAFLYNKDIPVLMPIEGSESGSREKSNDH